MPFPTMTVEPDDANLPEDVLLLEPRSTFDRALVGFAHQGGTQMAVYSRQAVLEALVMEEEMELEEAVEHYEYNVSGSIGLGYPVFLVEPDE